MDAQELKKTIRLYLETGNKIKPYLGERQLGELKANLDTLKKAISEEEWSKQIGRKYECFIFDIDYKIAEYQHGTHPNQDKPSPTPQPIPTPTPTPEPVKPDPIIKPKPDDLPTPDNSRPPSPSPEEEKPKPHQPTPEEIALENYNIYLKGITAETDTAKLADKSEWDKKINGLDYSLLDSQHQAIFLTEARQERLKILNDKENQAKWDKWFISKGILDTSEQNGWKASVNNSDQADLLFTEALKKDSNGQAWDPALSNEEAKGINESKSPANIKDAQNKIKNTRENIRLATELLESLTNYPELSTIPRSRDIKAAYDENWVPDNLKYEKLKEARNKRRAELFKEAFNGATDSQLSDEQIEAWRKASDDERGGTAGLPGDGVSERIAFNNKWLIEEIKGGKVANYKVEPETLADLDPLKLNKEQLKKALEILNDINDSNKKTFASLPENYRSEEIEALPADQPGHSNKEYLKTRIKERRSTFRLNLNEVSDGGLTAEQLTAARELEKGIYVAKGKEPAPASVINEVLRWEMTKDRTKGPELKWTEPRDLDAWLTSPENRGYRIEDQKDQEIKGKTYTGKEILEQENDKWGNPNHEEYDRGKQGRLLLPFFNKKVGFDPDNPEAFLCEPNNDTKGHLPYATGIGKTTKTVCCICKGGERHIILVLPTKSLALSALNSHNDWLQDYICPIHEIKHGEYNVEPFRIGDKGGLSVLTPGELLGYLLRNLISYTPTGIKGISSKGREDKIKEIKEGRKLKKDQHIILFDEADLADPTYQTIIEEATKQGYKCIKMSATFPGVPWSITTTNPIKSQLITGLRDEDLISENGQRKNILIFIRETEPRTKGKEVIEALTAEQKKLLAPYNYVVFDRTNAGAAEGITRGMDPGTIFFASPIFGRGFTFFIQKTIITNWMQTKILGGGWAYSEPATQRLPLSDLGQERGRVGRTEAGEADFLDNEIGEIKAKGAKKESIGTILTRAALTGSKEDLDTLAKFYSTFTKEGINFIRTAIAWPDKFGLLPEEILIGLNVGIDGATRYPKYEMKPTTGSPDADLWDRHMGIIKKSSMPKDTATNILKLMIANLVKRKTKENNFPDFVNIKIESPLIEQVGWTEIKEKPKKEEKAKYEADIKEVREVINGVISENIPDPATNQYKDENLFKKVVNCHKLAIALKISIERLETDEWIDKKDKTKGKKKAENLTLFITSNGKSTRSIGDFYGI